MKEYVVSLNHSNTVNLVQKSKSEDRKKTKMSKNHMTVLVISIIINGDCLLYEIRM